MRRIFLIISIISLLGLASVLSCQFSSWEGICAPLEGVAVYAGSASIQSAIFFLALYFLWDKDFKKTLASVGIPMELKASMFYTFMCLGAIFMLLLVLGAASLVLGFNDQQKVSDKITGLPFVILLFAAFGAPITEELFFRGLLTKRIGVLPSSIIFGLSHFTYGSTLEMLGAFSIGIVLAMCFRVSKSVMPCIMAHMAYNAMAIAFMVFFS